jgi:hypothetical protein
VRRDDVPVLSFEDDPTSAGARTAADRVNAFAAEHKLPAALRERLTGVVTDVVETLAGAVREPPERVCVEADIEVGNLQLVITHQADSQASVEELRPFLAAIGERCDDFSIKRRSATAVEVWACFLLG